MTLTWTVWKEDKSANAANAEHYLTPYADWYLYGENEKSTKGRFQNLRQERGPGRDLFPFLMHDLPLSKKSSPAGAKGIRPPQPRKDVLAGLTVHPKKTDIIVGVIDAGLALAHERFRRTGGIGTRILSHWAQGGDWEDQRHLPFGREVTQRDIDGWMGGKSEVDEAWFNRTAGLVNFGDPDGERWIETPAPHGTHVADLAAGCDPYEHAMSRLRDRSHLIFVDLAPRIAVGPAGSFLEDFAIWAIRHIVDTADAVWQALFSNDSDDSAKGFPIVINLSYGFNAGPKAGTLALQKYVRLLNHQRKNGPPVRLVLPAGNDNLSQGSAVLAERRERSETAALGWRILPEDRSSSYAEIWVDPDAEKRGSPTPSPGPIWLEPPSGPAGPGVAGQPGQFCELQDDNKQPVARIYCRMADTIIGDPDLDEGATQAIGYVLCVAPTWRLDGPVAPSGKWQIRLGEGPLAKLHVQSDQRLAPGFASSLLSYFEEALETPEDRRYRRFNSDGSLRDTYVQDPITRVVCEADTKGPVRRQNTMNAIGGTFGILTIAGYRATDGWPANYSGTARGFGIGGDGVDTRAAKAPVEAADSAGGKAFMEAACISDDSAWHTGRLAAGSRSGSATVMQGTSFATAEATRIVAGLLLDWVDAGRPDTNPVSATAFVAHAAHHDAAAMAQAAFSSPANMLPLKLGSGRLPRQDHGRVRRVVS